MNLGEQMGTQTTVVVATENGQVVVSATAADGRQFTVRMDAREAEQMAAQLHAAAQAVQ